MCEHSVVVLTASEVSSQASPKVVLYCDLRHINPALSDVPLFGKSEP